MGRLLWACATYVAMAGVLVAATRDSRAFLAPDGRYRAFGVRPGQSPLALSAALPALAVLAYALAAATDVALV